jgi:DNA-directed RNA polymerase subunit RPC12/RpoP
LLIAQKSLPLEELKLSIIVFAVFLFSLVFIFYIPKHLPHTKKKKKELPTPIGYGHVKFEIPLDKIVSVESTSPTTLQVKLAYNAEIIKLNFLNIVNFLGSNHYDFNSIIRSMNFDLYVEQRKQETNEFRKNLSSFVYEIQHRPKEVVSYNIVAEFNLNKDGTISVKCPYCGAPTPLHSKESEVVCKYCGKTYIVPKKILDLIS